MRVTTYKIKEENITKLKSYLNKKENEKSDKSKPRRSRSK
jgi:hypothetical protein